jgi:sodium-coupled monocarboxylate transporter 8/12
MRLAWMATIVSATSVAVHRLTGMATWQCIVLTAAVSTLYTLLGGMKAIVWTDVIQFILFTGGLVGALIVIGLHDSPKEMFEVLAANDKLRMIDFRLDPTIRITTVAAILGGIVSGLADVTDQVSMQRYLSSKSLRQAHKALWVKPLLGVPVTLMLFGLGLALFAHYKLHPGMAAGIAKGDQAFPHFILTEMPHGLAGLVIAAVFAAAMSSIDSGIHTLSTVTIQDYYKRLINPDMTDRSCLILARCLTVFWAVLVTIAALLFSKGESIVDMMNTLATPFFGCAVGIFILGTATRRTRAWGAFAGGLIGYGLVSWVMHGVGRVDGQWYLFTRADDVVRISWMWYPVVSFLGTVIPGYLISLFLPKSGADKSRGLNIWQQPAKAD